MKTMGSRKIVSFCCAFVMAGALGSMPCMVGVSRADERAHDLHDAYRQLQQARHDMDHGDLRAAREELRTAKDDLLSEHKGVHRDAALDGVNTALDALDHQQRNRAAEQTDHAMDEVQKALR